MRTRSPEHYHRSGSWSEASSTLRDPCRRAVDLTPLPYGPSETLLEVPPLPPPHPVTSHASQRLARVITERFAANCCHMTRPDPAQLIPQRHRRPAHLVAGEGRGTAPSSSPLVSILSSPSPKFWPQLHPLIGQLRGHLGRRGYIMGQSKGGRTPGTKG